MRASEYLSHQCSDVDNAVCEHQNYKSGNGNAHADGIAGRGADRQGRTGAKHQAQHRVFLNNAFCKFLT